MAIEKETAEMLAIKFPHSRHLLAKIEEKCKEIEERGHGWGRILIDSKGMNRAGRLRVEHLDVQYREFLDE